MSPPPSYNDLQKKVKKVLGKGFYSHSKATLDLKITDQYESKKNHTWIKSNFQNTFAEKKSGLSLTQGWSTESTINSKIGLPKLFKDLKSEVQVSVSGSTAKSAKLNASYATNKINTQASYNLIKRSLVAGTMTIGFDEKFLGIDLSYDFQRKSSLKTSTCLGIVKRNFVITLTSSNNHNQFISAIFFKLNPSFDVAISSTILKKSFQNFEVGGEYEIDKYSSIKSKLNLNGDWFLSIKHNINDMVSVGVGSCINIFHLIEPMHVLGFSLSFTC